MPSDTFSNGLGYLVMATGNDNNTWGTNANNSVFQIFEDSISGQLTVNTTGGTTDLSGSPPPAGPRADRYSQIFIQGTLTSNATIKVCQLPKIWQVFNNTTGAFDVIMETSNGSAVPITIPRGKMVAVSCVSTTQLIRSDHAEVGDYVTTSAIPAGLYGAGVLAANGAAVSRVGKVDLFTCIGTTYGVGDGSTTFNLPQVQDTGRYLRSYIPGTTTVGTTQANQFAAHTHTLSATSATESATHTHTYSGTTATEGQAHNHDSDYPHLVNTTGGGGGTGDFFLGTDVQTHATSNELQNHTHTYSGTSATESATHTHTLSGTTSSAGSGAETRPETMIVWMGIRY
jgi:microcystin-dependent protein